MKRNFFLFLFLFTIGFQSVGQVSDIKDAAKNSKSSKSSSGSSSADACLDSGCAEAIVQVAFYVFYEALVQHHRYQMGDRHEDPFVLSLDVMPHLAFSPNDEYVNFLPRIRGNWGVLSTDFRMNYLAEFDSISAQTYRTIDWEIIQINIRPTKHFRLTLGAGLMFEDYTDKVYNENYIGMQFRLADMKFLIDLEGRYAYNTFYEESYETDSWGNDVIVGNSATNTVFQEYSLRGSYRIFDSKHFSGYTTFGVSYQNYYKTVELISVTGGLTVNIH